MEGIAIPTPPLILSLGSINADFQVRTERPLTAGATLLGSAFARRSGGKAANVAYLARLLGCHALLCGRVGDDDLGEQALPALRGASVSLECVTRASGTATGVSMISVGPDGKKTIVLAANANDSWDSAAEEAVEHAVGGAPPGSVLAADCEVPVGIVTRAALAARWRGFKLVLDPAPADRASPELLGLAHAITPDAREAGHLARVPTATPENAAQAAAILSHLGVPLVCIKLADGGCIASFEGRTLHVPPVPVEIVDTTGAGDAFTGALAVALLEDQPPRSAVLFATAASHVSVTRYGSQESYPRREEIEALVPRLAAQAHELRL
jgi:ribokinase